MNKIFKDENWEEKPLLPISVAAELVGTSPQTLRLYEKHKLITPARRNKNRFYSQNDIKWIKCLRNLLHEKKISLEGVKKLLHYAPCWELRECSQASRDACSAYITQTKPCWEMNKTICKMVSGKICESCAVFLSQAKKEKNKKP